MTAPYPSLRRPLLAIVLGCAVGIAAGLAAGLSAWWQLGDSGVPTNGGHGLVALLLAVLTAIGYSVSFLVPALNWFAAVWAGCVALALSIDLCQRRQRSVPKAAALVVLVLTSGLGLLAMSAWARGYDPGHPAQLLAMIAPALACSAALLLALPVLLSGHFVGRRRARRAMPTHAAAGA
ncbi:putative membrane protein [Xanthomonas translucens]